MKIPKVGTKYYREKYTNVGSLRAWRRYMRDCLSIQSNIERRIYMTVNQ